MPMFRCPSCGAEAQVGEEFAGKHIVCPKCQQSGPVPTSADATPQGITTPELAQPSQPLRRAEDELPDALPSIRAEARRSWFRLGILTFGVLAVLGTMIGIYLIAVAKVQTAADRTQSICRLKGINLAFHGFHDAHRRLPFNGSDMAIDGIEYTKKARAGKSESGSWAFQILPFVDQAAVFMNPEASRNLGIHTYMCPGRGRPIVERGGGPWTDYFLNNYINNPRTAALPDTGDMKRSFKDITDGTSNTILLGHGNINIHHYGANMNVLLSSNIFLGGTLGTMRSGVSGAVSPAGVTLKRDSHSAPHPGAWGGPFAEGGIMGMADGTTKVFPYMTQNFSAFLTPTGGEAVILPD